MTSVGQKRRRVRRSRGVLAACSVAVAAATFTTGTAHAGAGTFRLNPGEQLVAGQRLVSPNGQNVLVMQGDGNLVEYAPGNRAIWATGSSTANSVVVMQGDGNLVVVAPGNRPVWASNTGGNQNADLELQDDGNVVVYGQGHVARWASGSSPTATTAQRIAGIARAEAGNLLRKGENGVDCNFYSGALHSGGPCSGGWYAEAWCADFARWVWGQAGARTDLLGSGAGSFFSYGRSKGTWRAGNAAGNARVGDAVVFNLSGTYADHVGIVTAVNGDGTITMISGNYSNAVSVTTFNPTARLGSLLAAGYASPAG